jgi:cytochrome c5
MKTLLKWIGIVLGVLVGLIVVAAVAVFAISSSKMNRKYNVTVDNVPIPTDADSLARGKHLVEAVGGCQGCHGEDFSGMPILNDPAVAVIYSANLTSGQGGVGATFTDADFVRAIRHGVTPDGRGLLIMPSDDYHNFDDADLGAIIAYIKTVPPVDHVIPAPAPGPVGRVLFTLGALPESAASRIDHNNPPPAAPAPGVNADYGNYLASIACKGCHGPGLSGGPIPGGDPNSPPARNLTPSGELAGWSEADFVNTLRTGVTPSGEQLPGEFMPWPELGRMTDDELGAVWAYLQSVPARDAGTR